MDEQAQTDAKPQVNVGTAENVNVPADIAAHPAVVWIVGFVTVGVLLGFGWVTFALLNGDTGVTAETKGAVIQTWNNLAVAAAAVWTTSSVVNRIKGQR